MARVFFPQDRAPGPSDRSGRCPRPAGRGTVPSVGAKKPENGGRDTARRKPSAIRKRKPEEAQAILERILERHPELRIEAETSAHDPGGEESVEWTAEFLGLYRAKRSQGEGASGWAPDFPADTATDAIEKWLAAGKRKGARKPPGKRAIARLRQFLLAETPGWVREIDRLLARGGAEPW